MRGQVAIKKLYSHFSSLTIVDAATPSLIDFSHTTVSQWHIFGIIFVVNALRFIFFAL
jgi:hypothetical protein